MNILFLLFFAICILASISGSRHTYVYLNVVAASVPIGKVGSEMKAIPKEMKWKRFPAISKSASRDA